MPRCMQCRQKISGTATVCEHCHTAYHGKCINDKPCSKSTKPGHPEDRLFKEYEAADVDNYSLFDSWPQQQASTAPSQAPLVSPSEPATTTTSPAITVPTEPEYTPRGPLIEEKKLPAKLPVSGAVVWLVAHGVKRSGTVLLPDGMKAVFYTQDDHVLAQNRATLIFSGNVKPVDEYSGKMPNYRLDPLEPKEYHASQLVTRGIPNVIHRGFHDISSSKLCDAHDPTTCRHVTDTGDETECNGILAQIKQTHGPGAVVHFITCRWKEDTEKIDPLALETVMMTLGAPVEKVRELSAERGYKLDPARFSKYDENNPEFLAHLQVFVDELTEQIEGGHSDAALRRIASLPPYARAYVLMSNDKISGLWAKNPQAAEGLALVESAERLASDIAKLASRLDSLPLASSIFGDYEHAPDQLWILARAYIAVLVKAKILIANARDMVEKTLTTSACAQLIEKAKQLNQACNGTLVMISQTSGFDPEIMDVDLAARTVNLISTTVLEFRTGEIQSFVRQFDMRIK